MGSGQFPLDVPPSHISRPWVPLNVKSINEKKTFKREGKTLKRKNVTLSVCKRKVQERLETRHQITAFTIKVNLFKNEIISVSISKTKTDVLIYIVYRCLFSLEFINVLHTIYVAVKRGFYFWKTFRKIKNTLKRNKRVFKLHVFGSNITCNGSSGERLGRGCPTYVTVRPPGEKRSSPHALSQIYRRSVVITPFNWSFKPSRSLIWVPIESRYATSY